MNVYGPCLFRNFAKEDETGVHGNLLVCASFVAGVPLKVADHLMGGRGLAHHLSKERLRGNMKFVMWHRLMQDGATFFGGRHVAQNGMG